MSSCKKDDEQKYVYFPETLYLTQITNLTPVRLFTKNREITNADTITRFIKNETNFNLQNQAIDASETMVFESKSLAQLGNPKQAYNLNSDFATTKTEFIFFSQKQYPVNPQDLAFLLLKFKAPLIANGVAPNITYTTKDVRVANGNYLDLNFGALSYKIKQLNGTQSGTTYNQPINIDAKALVQLQTTDTLALQYFIYNYKVK
ncbi:MAG: hypothetical protein EAY66_01205 [Sphingobacteriales bacterium]|nr:MAG: hypothetical protein EAY66_01205 [Sphingobacteriales bacterium]